MRITVTIDDTLYQQAIELADPGMDEAAADGGIGGRFLSQHLTQHVVAEKRSRHVAVAPDGHAQMAG